MADLAIYEGQATNINAQLELQAAGIFGDNAWFGVDQTFIGEDVNGWVEHAIEAGLTIEAEIGGGHLFGALSYVDTRGYDDDASGLSIGKSSLHALHVEQAHIGWRSGEGLLGLGADAVTVQAGRFDYSIGTGLLINDGGGDGGDRGGWWLGARKAFEDSFLLRIDTGPWLAELFYLENDPRRGGAEGKARGVNLEYAFESTGLELGASYLDIDDRDDTEFEQFDAWSLRATYAVPRSGWIFDGEVVEEGDGSDGDAYWLRGAHQWQEARWQPAVSYRYAALSGDDLNTTRDERFRPAAYGFTDYGSWFQGEIAGNYPLENSNLISHTVGVTVTPSDALEINLLAYHFRLDEEQIFGDPVVGDGFGDEFNLLFDWAVNDRLFVNATFGVLIPDDAAESWTGGDDNWTYGVLSASYTF